MSEQNYVIVFDPESGIQLLNTETNEVLDVAVLERTERPMGSLPAIEEEMSGVPLKQYGSLRIRSSASTMYRIAFASPQESEEIE